MPPPNYTCQTIEDTIEIAIKVLREDGIIWLPTTRPFVKKVSEAVRERLGRFFALYYFEPDFEFVLVDLDQYPEIMQWGKTVATKRDELRRNGASDHLLPTCPADIEIVR